MILMARDSSQQRSKEVDGPLVAQCHRTNDRMFTRRGRQLRTSSISMGSIRPCFAFPGALAGPSALRVDQAEERALVHAAVVDVEGRANVLLHQLDDANCRDVGGFFLLSIFPLVHL
jgi:hypothetical protein